MHTTPTRAGLWLPSVGLLISLLLGACGGDEAISVDAEGRAAFLRLSLVREGAVPDSKPESVARFALADQALAGQSMGDWIAEAPKATVRRIPPEDARIQEARQAGKRPKGVIAAYLEGEGPKSLRVPCDLEASSFNRVLVNLRNYGGQAEIVSVTVSKNGRVVARSPWVSFKARGGLRPLSASFPELRNRTITIDEVSLETKGESKGIAITHFDLILSPLETFLPALDGRGAMVPMGDEDRRCVGLSSRAPLTAELMVPDGAELFYSFAQELRLLGRKEQARLRVTVNADGAPPLEKVHKIASESKAGSAWGEGRMDLAAFADKRARIRFELSVQGEMEGFCLVGEAAVSRRAKSAPTVLLVTSDTHRADHMGAAGAEGEESPVRTPHLDALGERGVYFSRAYASTNVTNPSHVALMTGMSPRDTRVLNNTTRLLGQATTLAECFQEEGFRTMAIVSAYHLLDSESGLGQGFDRVSGPRRNDRDGGFSVDMFDKWVAGAQGQPLFIWLHLFDAHAPYGPPSPYDQRYWKGPRPFDSDAVPPLDERMIPEFLKGLTDVDFPYQQYRGEVDYVDVLMGRVLDNPRMAGATVAFTSDHGESFGEHGVWWDHADLYPQTVHVPMILSWPGGPEGIRSDELVQQIDLGRTLLDLADLKHRSFPGRNLDWALEEYPAADATFELSAHGNAAAIQTSRWRLMMHLRSHHELALAEPREKHRVELYDLDADPNCLEDLVRKPEHYQRAKGMREKLLGWLADADPVGLGESKTLTIENLKSLESLGYGGNETGAMRAGDLYEEDPQDEWCEFFAR